MDLRQVKSNNSNSSPMSNPVLPDEIIRHIVSYLSVKEILRLKTVCKSWYTFISDPFFIKMYVKKSTPTPTVFLSKPKYLVNSSLLPFPARALPFSISFLYPKASIVGACNGLLCFHGFTRSDADKKELWFRFWNPATHKVSENFGNVALDFSSNTLKLAFGYDILSDSYKIVRLHVYGHYSKTIRFRNEVKVLGSGDNVWRSLQIFPAIPVGYYDYQNAGVYVNGTLNWLAVHNNCRFIDWNTITVKQVVIVSLDPTQLLPPKGFDTVPLLEPSICTLTGCLCFVHDVEQTHFVIWRMLEFGVEQSWTQYFKINYQSIQNGNINLGENYQLLPVCLSKNGDALILANGRERYTILYYWNDNRTEIIQIPNGKWRCWHYDVWDYVESLAPTG